MAYKTGPLPATSTPAVLAVDVWRELARIQTALDRLEVQASMKFNVLTSPPPGQFQAGSIIYANATALPQLKEGLYRYDTGGAWQFIG